MIKFDISTISIVLSHSEYYISQLISGNNKSFLIEKKSLEMAPISVSVKPFIAKFLSMQAEILAKEEQKYKPTFVLLCSVSRKTKSG